MVDVATTIAVDVVADEARTTLVPVGHRRVVDVLLECVAMELHNQAFATLGAADKKPYVRTPRSGISHTLS
jgi:hypothetical protein